MNQAVKVLLDLLVIFLFVLGIAKGAKKGFVQTLYQAIRWIVCIILAQILYPYVAEFLQKIGLTGMLQKSLEGMIGSAMQGSGNTSMIQSLPLPDFLKDVLISNDNSVVYEFLNVTTLTGYVAAYLARMAVNALSILVLLVLAIVGTKLIGAALDILTKLPVIHSLNAFLGGVAGILSGIFYVWLLVLLVFFVAVIGSQAWLSDAAAQTVLLNFANEFNPLLRWAVSFTN